MKCWTKEEECGYKYKVHQLIQDLHQLEIQNESALEQIRIIKKRVASLDAIPSQLKAPPIRQGLEWEPKEDFSKEVGNE